MTGTGPINKISPKRIVSDHLSTLVEYPHSRVSIPDILFFFGLPLAGSSVVVWFGFNLKTDILNGLLAAFAILAGLLLNLLVLVFSLTQTAGDRMSVTDDAVADRRWMLLRQLHSNISFAILIAFGLVVITTVALWAVGEQPTKAVPAVTNGYYTFAIAFLAMNFVLTAMMVLKRMHLLIANEFDRQRPKPARRNVA